MALAILKNTHQETIVKAAEAGTYAVDISTLANAGQAVVGTPAVNIAAVLWTGDVGSKIVLSRNGTVVLTMAGEAAAEFDFNCLGYVDTTENESDISIVITGSAQLFLTLRKVGGFATKIETAQFSVYDDTNAVGS